MKQFVARLGLALGRYRLVTPAPTDRVMVLVAAPHTSNWDFVLMLLMAWKAGLSPRWLGKREMFDGVLGPLFRRLGGVTVDRNNPAGLVDDLVAQARTEDSLCIVIPAEGTRSKGEYWKSGFYRIAKMAEIPIVLSYLDGPSRTGGFGPHIVPSDDVAADMDLVRAFYADKAGVKPKNKTEPRLREEGAAVTGPAA
ncbi:MAG: 1-acyl-sn-glycerol-3-phosphate acyltransferase [Microthrixaceae bacterium]